LRRLPELHSACSQVKSNLLNGIGDCVEGFDNERTLLNNALNDEVPATLKDGGVIKTGFDETLDELRGLSENADNFLTERSV